jgi:hypothetical protein
MRTLDYASMPTNLTVVIARGVVSLVLSGRHTIDLAVDDILPRE